MKKEDYIKENARLENALTSLEGEFDGFTKTARRNLAVTLGIPTSKSNSYGNNTDVLPEWSEIYARIGRLRTLAEQKDQADSLHQLEDKVYMLDDEIRDIKHRTNLD